MTKSVSVVLTLQPLLVPAGTVAGVFHIALSKADGTAVSAQDSPDGVVTFSAVDAGDYVVAASRLDAAGLVLGVAVTSAFTIPADQVSVDVPASITVTVG